MRILMRRCRVVGLAAAVILFVAAATSAEDVRVMTSGAFTAAYRELVPQFEHATHDKVISSFGASMGDAPDSIPGRLRRGEPADVVILAAQALDDLIRQGKVVAGSRVDLVESRIGMAVKSGTPKPDISSVDGLVRALLKAKSIAYSDSASGVYLSTVLFPRLGVASQVKGKATRILGNERVGAVVARGDAEVGFQQISELLPVPGITVVGPLPPGAQQVTIFSAGIVAGAKAPQAAARLIAFFTSSQAAPVIARSGLDPIATADLQGTIDIHIHTEPDSRPRSVDAVDAARQAKASGMRAIVLKNHYEFTSGLAYIVRKQVPGIEVFGGVDLNLTVGGINAAAVEYMAATTGGFGRVVWMPTFDSENQVRYSKESRPFVSISKNGALLPQVAAVIASIAKHGLVLATGHSSAEEGLMLLREGRRQGVQHMVVTHAMNEPILMTVEQMKEAATLGAFIEFVGGNVADQDGPARMDRFADAIRRIGPQFCILSSDLGQKDNPLPAPGYGAFLAAMRARGLTAQDLDRMSKRNPAQLLGLN
jgi:ABC-type molybdate transport system substrate-binding protein